MSSAPPNARNERDETDSSLRSEREKSDDELSKRGAAIEEDSNEVVDHARQRADEVLGRARELADEKLSGSVARDALEEERELEDAALREERLVDDKALAREREERRRALASLMRFEREQTDEHLLSERSRADDLLAARDEFMAMVSHDLRTLLGGIALSTALQMRHAKDDEAGRQTVDAARKIQRSTARMNRLIGDLIDVTSIEAGRLSMELELRDVVALIRETVEAFQPAASTKGIALEVELAEGTVLARFDHGRILQVLANLLSNAMKFTREGGRISLRVAPAGSDVLFSVSDTGSGIPPDQLEAIFERFWQVKQHDRRGLGLGLFIARCVLDAHGGRVWAESELGRGSRFFFTLPAEKPEVSHSLAE
ncbi:MAG: HAMP domain-containing histidine kinase [Myxococcales bacterium]|nr:MAG: HAMP domain-containing histidine kinase [Myxococcales bacterium]